MTKEQFQPIQPEKELAGIAEEMPASELLKLTDEINKFLDSHQPLFTTFSRDVSLVFKPQAEAETFSIDLEKGRVILAAKWFWEQGYSLDQILWACFHELSHFCDLKSDPKSMLENFDYINSKGKEARAYRTFYNVFDDIFVNQLLANKAPIYEAGSPGAEEIKKLYEKKLFERKDYRNIPRHLQFLYAILRKRMVPDEEIILDPEVQEIIDEGVKIWGEKYTFDEFLKKYISPTVSTFTKEENFPEKRYKILRQKIEPIFTKLLAEDQEDPKFKKPRKGEPGEGKGEPNFDDYYDEFDKKNPDQIDPEKIKEWAINEQEKNEEEERKKQEEKEEEAKTPQQRAKEVQQRMDGKFAQDHNIPLPLMKRFRRIETKINPYLEELSSLWRSIVYGRSEDIRVALEGFYKTGIDIAIPEVIKEWPKIETGRLEETRIYIRPVEKIIMRERPELIRVHLVCDLSGSMDEAKREILKQTVVLLLRSLEEFQSYLNMTRNLTKSKLNVATEVWGFGDRAERLKDLNKGFTSKDAEQDRVGIIKTIGRLDENFGSTFDDKALWPIARNIETEPGAIEAIKKEKIMEIVIEITDGGSSDKSSAIKAVKKLEDLEVICRAIQIGETGEDEKKTFKEVWKDKGEAIGKKIENLPKAVAVILAKYLGAIKL